MDNKQQRFGKAWRTLMKYFWIFSAAVVVFCVCSFIAGAKWLKIRRYSVRSKKLICSEGLVRITLISDLHERSFGKNNRRLIEKIESTQPDIIVIAGDTADVFGKVGGAYEPLFKALPKIAPTFMVLGNHEYSARRDMEISGMAKNNGITVLDDMCAEINVRGDVINIIGLSDYYRENVISQTLAERLDLVPVPDFLHRYNILVSHRPTELEEIAQRGIDLMLCGHTHGGQMRIPILGGVFTPCSHKLFPKYDMGFFGIKKMNLIISAGLGTSTVPLRFCNRPEIAVIDLECEE